MDRMAYTVLACNASRGKENKVSFAGICWGAEDVAWKAKVTESDERL